MKNKVIVLLVLGLLMFVGKNIFANETTDKDWAFTFYPIGTIYASNNYSLLLSGEVEYKINNYFSFPIEIRYMGMIVPFEEVSSVHVLALGPGFRFYPQGRGISGFFIGHYLQFIGGVYDSPNGKVYGYEGIPKYYISTSWLGYRWLFEKWHLEISVGAFDVLFIKEKDEMFGRNVVIPLIGLGCGISF